MGHPVTALLPGARRRCEGLVVVVVVVVRCVNHMLLELGWWDAGWWGRGPWLPFYAAGRQVRASW